MVASAIGNIAGSAIGDALGQSLASQISQLNTYEKNQLASVNAKAVQEKKLEEGRNQQKLNKMSKPSSDINPNHHRAKRFQESASPTKDWQAWEEGFSQDLFDDVMDSINVCANLKTPF